jgi:hypothetical protein
MESYNGHDKIERYGWAPVKVGPDGNPGVYTEVPKGSLRVDYSYQRQPSQSRVITLARDWDAVKAGALVVSQRADGSLYVIDGGTRLLAAMERSDVRTLFCLIFRFEKLADEAAYFYSLNTASKRVPAAVVHKAGVVACDPVALDAERIMAENGYTHHISGKAAGREIHCLATLRRCVAADEALASRVFKLCCDITGEGPIMKDLLAGCFYVASHPGQGSIFDPRFADRLISAGPEKIRMEIRSAVALTGRGGDKVFASAIVKVANARLSRHPERRLTVSSAEDRL